MAGKYQDYNLSIKENLPEWMKNDVFLDVMEKYTEEFEADIVNEFLKHLGLIQPVQVWKDIPVEYNYVREYEDFDEVREYYVLELCLAMLMAMKFPRNSSVEITEIIKKVSQEYSKVSMLDGVLNAECIYLKTEGVLLKEKGLCCWLHPDW